MNFNFDRSTILPFIAILGIVSVAVMGIDFLTGLILFLLPAGLLIALIVRSKRTAPQSSTQVIPAMKIISSEFEITGDVRGKPAPQPVLPTPYEPLLTALRIQGFNLQVPVIETDGEPVTAADIFIEIAGIMAEKGDTLERMKPLLPVMYSRLWDYTEEACKRYGDLGLIKIHIASSVYFQIKLEQTKL
jgi:hypothetical protein